MPPITRYTEATPVQHTGQFFQLPYEVLKEPILKLDQEYKQTQSALDEYYSNLASQDYLKGDLELATQKREALQDKEKNLRTTVGGDLTDPRYQQGLRDLIRKEANDPFYKKAAYNFTIYNQVYLPHRLRYMEKTGTLPKDWQDPYAAQMAQYKNAEENGIIPFQGVETRIPFQPLALETLKPVLDKKIMSGKIEVRQTPEGVRYLAHVQGGEVTKDELKKIIQDSDLLTQRAYTQLKLDFESTPELKERYGSFDKYFDESVLESIGNTLAYKWNTEEFASWVPEWSQKDSTRRIRSPRTSGKKEKINIQLGPATTYTGAQKPTGTPTRKLWNDLIDYHESALIDMLEGGERVDENGNVVKIPKLADNVKMIMGIPDEMPIQVNVLESDSNNELAINLTYKDSTGTDQTINLLGPDLLIRAKEFAPNFRRSIDEAITDIHKINTEYTRHRAAVDELKRFKNEAGAHVFGEDWARVKKEGFVSLMKPEERQKFLRDDRVLAILGSNGPVNVRTELEKIANPIMGRNLRPQDVEDLARYLDIPEEEYQSKLPIARAEYVLTKFNELISKDSDAPTNIINRARSSALNDRAIDYVADKDPRVKRWEQMFNERWEKGYNHLFQPQNTVSPSKTGIRQQIRHIYHLNASNTADGDRWTKNLTSLIESAVSAGAGGDFDQKETFSKIGMYNFGTDESLSPQEYTALARRDDKGNPFGVDVVGVSFDDDGIVLVLQGKLDAAENKLYEIRNQDLVIDYMAASGMGDKLIFNIMNGALKSFNAPEGDPYSGGVMRPGQNRSNLTGEIGEGLFIRPIERLVSDKQENGKVYKAGTYKYWSLTDKKYNYHDNMLDVTLDYFRDRVQTMDKAGRLTTFTPEDFQGKIANADEYVRTGKNSISHEMLSYVQEIVEDPNLPENLYFNSVMRDPDHALSRANPSSRHLMGDAVDFRVKSEGKINDNLVDFWYNKWQSNKRELPQIHIQLEFNNLNDPNYKAYKEKYGDFVKFVPHSTGEHIHVEFNRELQGALEAGTVEFK